MTWLNFSILFFLPVPVLMLPAFIPDFWGKSVGGLYRQFMVQNLIDILPNSAGLELTVFFGNAGFWLEIAMVLVIVINITAVLAWPIWFVGHLLIGISNWSGKKDLELRRSGLRRS